MQGRLSGARRILPRSRRDLQGCGRGVPQGGCRCLRFDDTVWAYLCSQKELDLAKQHGDDPTRLPEIYARVINEAIKNRPSDMTITTHVCRGNFRSPGFSEGGYAPSPRCCSAGERRRQFPRIRHRAGRRLRAAAVRAEGQQADRARPHDLEIRNSWRRKRTSRSASRRRRITSHSTSSAPRRSAAMPRPRKATCRPRPPNGTR